MKVAIIGGGISGLSTAFYIKRLSPTSQITIYEKENRFGGKLQTDKKTGFSVESTAIGINTADSEVGSFLAEFNVGVLEQSEVSKAKFIFDKKKLFKFPSTTKELFSSGFLTIAQKITLFFEKFRGVSRAKKDESLYEFGLRRFGKGFTESVLDAYATAMYAAIPDKLSVESAFGKLKFLEKEYGSVLKGIKDGEKNIENGSFVGFDGGMASFIDSIAVGFSFTKKLGTEVISVVKSGSEWIVETGEGRTAYDSVVIAAPSYVAARLLKEDSELAEPLKSIEYTPVAVVALGYDELEHQMDGFGFVTTRRSKAPVLGVSWDSSIFASYAPSGKKLLRVFIGGQRAPMSAVKDEKELVNIATWGVFETMGVYAEPSFWDIERWHKGIPSYGINHKECVDGIFEKLKDRKGLFLNSNSYRGVRIADCIKNSKLTAVSVIGG